MMVSMNRYAREDIRQVLDRFGISAARRAADTEGTEEEIILLSKDAYDSADIDSLTRALMAVLPHTKVWVVADHPRWNSEPL